VPLMSPATEERMTYNASSGPAKIDPMAHEYGDQNVHGYAVCSLCGYIECAQARIDDYDCWKKKRDQYTKWRDEAQTKFRELERRIRRNDELMQQLEGNAKNSLTAIRAARSQQPKTTGTYDHFDLAEGDK